MLSYRTINIEIDREIIVTFRKDAFVVSFGTDEVFRDEEAYVGGMKERVGRFPDGQVLIEMGDETIGQMELDIKEYDGNEIGYVNLYYLISAYRNKGLGKQLVHYAEEFFKKHGVSEYHLRVSQTNQAAIRLYTKHGMELAGEEHEQYALYRMKKHLS
jgi:ribosomal protein S18 acetylase RimI-like enzyme